MFLQKKKLLRLILALLAIGLFVVLIVVWSHSARRNMDGSVVTPSPPGTLPPSIMVENILYYYTGNYVTIDVDEESYLGRISSVVSLSKMPSENGQTNLPYKDSPFIRYEDGIALLMDGRWGYFETREDEES